MLNNSALQLTDYQRAILTEVGVTFWQFRDPNKPVDEPAHLAGSQDGQQSLQKPELVSQTQVKSPTDALSALQQLKEEVLTVESTGNVLLALSNQEIASQMMSDVLMALGLENKPYKQVSTEQLAHFKDYPLSWQQGETLALNDNQLSTGSLAELRRPEMKKQLWQLIQKHLIATQ